MIEDFAERFWRERAQQTSSSIRWTDDEMIRVDLDLVGGFVADGAAILDLGCGTGDLFLPFLDRLGHVTAVDMIPEFLARIPDDPRIEKVVSTIAGYRPVRTFDLALMFGVVTHLSDEDESTSYRILREAVPDGVVIVKNQCGSERDLLVDTHSAALGSRYVGRYPHVEAQAARLREVFPSVDVVPYPPTVNRWENSIHVAFVCR